MFVKKNVLLPSKFVNVSNVGGRRCTMRVVYHSHTLTHHKTSSRYHTHTQQNIFKIPLSYTTKQPQDITLTHHKTSSRYHTHTPQNNFKIPHSHTIKHP